METIEKYGIFEYTVKGVPSSAPTEGAATFRNGETVRQVHAFLTGAGEYRIRFMPEEEGLWNYQISICGREQEGTLQCVPERIMEKSWLTEIASGMRTAKPISPLEPPVMPGSIRQRRCRSRP